MTSFSNRLLLGFGAGALSYLIFQGALGSLYFAADLIPALPWSLRPVPPLGVPVSVSLAFWAGLWGIVYAAVEPRLTPRLGWIAGGIVFGIAPLLVRWFVVLPLKGAPVAEGLQPMALGIYVGFHLIFGLGLAVILGFALDLVRHASKTQASVLRG
jgi:hypothetical protein